MESEGDHLTKKQQFFTVMSIIVIDVGIKAHANNRSIT
jgi:hypothetical protein